MKHRSPIFRNGDEGPHSRHEKQRRRRLAMPIVERDSSVWNKALVDLHDVLHLLRLGRKITVFDFDRIRAAHSSDAGPRSVDAAIRRGQRLYSEVESVASQLGHSIRFIPNEEDEGALWVLEVEDEPGLTAAVAGEFVAPSTTKKSEAQRQRRDLYRRAGLCIDCKAPAVEGKSFCRDCLREAAERGAATHARSMERSRRGLCYACGDPVDDGATLCKLHLKAYAQYAANRRRRLAEKGLCGQCGSAPPVDGRSLCARCQSAKDAWTARYRQSDSVKDMEREYARAAIQRARQKGLCIKCKQRPPMPGRSQCVECLRAGAELRAQRKAAGLCSLCGKPAEPGRSKCAKHLAYYADRARKTRP